MNRPANTAVNILMREASQSARNNAMQARLEFTKLANRMSVPNTRALITNSAV